MPTEMSLRRILPRRPAHLALLLAVGATATIGGALFIEHALGVKPCELCLQQRIPYYAGVPLAFVAAAVAAQRPAGLLAQLLLWGLCLLFLAGAALGGYHAGVELGWWPGPTGCTGPIAKPSAMGDFLKQLETTKVVRCDEVTFRMLGQSLAAWNAVLSVGFAGLAGIAAMLARAARA